MHLDIQHAVIVELSLHQLADVPQFHTSTGMATLPNPRAFHLQLPFIFSTLVDHEGKIYVVKINVIVTKECTGSLCIDFGNLNVSQAMFWNTALRVNQLALKVK